MILSSPREGHYNLSTLLGSTFRVEYEARKEFTMKNLEGLHIHLAEKVTSHIQVLCGFVTNHLQMQTLKTIPFYHISHVCGSRFRARHSWLVSLFHGISTKATQWYSPGGQR